MATRAKALKKFAKNVLHHDLTGMSETAVLKDLLKQEFNIDAVGNSVVSVLMNAASSDGGEEGFEVRFKDGDYYANVFERETNVFTLEISSTAINVSNLIATDNHEPVDLTGATLTVEGFTYSAMDFAYVKSVQQGEYTDGQVISVNVNVTKGDYSGVAVFTCAVNA